MHLEKIPLPATDGYLLGGYRIWPKTEAKGVVQLNSATGVKKEFYLKFAQYLAENGYFVYLYDYRGIGESRPATLKNFDAHMHDWGIKDQAGVFSFIVKHHYELPKYLVGHSVGGQFLGFYSEKEQIRQAVLICSSSGYWGNMQAPYKYFTLFVWHIMWPLLRSLFGYAKVNWLKLGEDLPKGVMQQWRNWCLNPEYNADFLMAQTAKTAMDQVRFPIAYFGMTDDPISTSANIDWMMSKYPIAPSTKRMISPAEARQKKIGHLDFFRQKTGGTLWPDVLKKLEVEEQKTSTTPSA